MILYETQTQPQVSLLFVLFGFLCGFVFDLKNILTIKNKGPFLSHFYEFVASLFLFFTFYFLNLKANFGSVRNFSFIMFFLSFFLQRFLITNFVAKPLSKCYNKFRSKRDEKKMVEKS